MAPTPIPSGFGIATVKYQNLASGRTYVVDFGFTDDATITPPVIANDIAAAWLGAFTAATTLNSYAFTGVSVLINRAGTFLSGQNIQHTAGTVAAEAVSPAVAPRVTKYTGVAGRAHRGRMYLQPAFLPEANVNTSGVIDAATQASIQTHADAFLDALGALSIGPMVLLHNDLSTPDEVLALQVRSTVGTQRRRQLIA